MRHLPSPGSAALLAGALLLCPPVSAAQRPAEQPDTGSVPRVLAVALLRATPVFTYLGGGRPVEPRLYVGTLPPNDSSRMFVPAGARILGSSVSGPFRTAVIAAAEPSDSALGIMRRGLVALGWRSIDDRSTAPMPGGFWPAPRPKPEAIELCRRGATVAVSAERTGDGGTLLTMVVVSRRLGVQVCNPSPPSIPDDAGRPTLMIPPGADPSSVCPPGRGFSFSSAATVRAALSPSDLLAYFARQLRDSGWTSAPAAVAAWTRRDSSGTHQEVAVTVMQNTADTACFDLRMESRRVP